MQNKDNFREVWDSIEEEHLNEEETQQRNWKKINKEIQRSTRRKIFFTFSTVVVVLFGFWFLANQNGVENKTEYLAKNHEKQIVLKDGTQIKLFENSKLTVENDFNKIERRVSLSGKAEFKVTKLAEKKFVVESEMVEVSVLGTTFLVNNEHDDNSVELFEGKVRIDDKQTNKSAILLPQQVWEKDKSGASKMFYSKTKELNFSFNNDDFDKAVKEISDSYNVKIDYPKEFKNKKITGSFTGNLETILKITSFPFNLKIEKRNEEYYHLTE